MKTAKKNGSIPLFKNYEEEATWWDTHDLADYSGEFEKPRLVIPDKNKKVKSVFVGETVRLSEILNVRFDEKLLQEIRKIASKKGIGPTTLVRMWALEKLQEEQRSNLIT
jgi:predicted DNA binding CopG/RHH family protein